MEKSCVRILSKERGETDEHGRERERRGVERNHVRGHHRRLRILAGPLWLIKGARSGLLCAADLLLGLPETRPSSAAKYNFRQARR